MPPSFLVSPAVRQAIDDYAAKKKAGTVGAGGLAALLQLLITLEPALAPLLSLLIPLL